VDHYVFPAKGSGQAGHTETRALWNDDGPKRVLVTGGASCPDGIIQQVIIRINGFFPPEKLRKPDDVLADLV
jgi:4-hydroxy-3-methylbut-2-en-1-yl diphosphate reductase